MRPLTFTERVADQLAGARASFAPLNSAHEGYAVILEEVEELWEEVRKKRDKRDQGAMAMELVQIAAMCQRMAEDLNLLGSGSGEIR